MKSAEGPVRRVGAHGEPQRVARDADDEREVVDRMPRGLLHVRQPQHPRRELCQGVAIGLRIERHVAGTQRSARTGLVMDNDLLPQVAPGDLGQHAQMAIGRAARRPRHDQVDRPVREGLRQRIGPRRDKRDASQQQRGERTRMESSDGHGSHFRQETTGRHFKYAGFIVVRSAVRVKWRGSTWLASRMAALAQKLDRLMIYCVEVRLRPRQQLPWSVGAQCGGEHRRTQANKATRPALPLAATARWSDRCSCCARSPR